MLFCEFSENYFPWPGGGILKAVEYQPSGHRASLQLWNFCPMPFIEPLPSLQVSKEERWARAMGTSLSCPGFQPCLQAAADQSPASIRSLRRGAIPQLSP